MKFKLTNEQKEIFKSCVALKDDEHWAVFILLLHHQALTLTEIRVELDSTYWETKPILEDLIRGNLVEQFIMKNEDVGNLDKRYYRITTDGLRFHYLIMEAVFPWSH
jgi:hypothetical protein